MVGKEVPILFSSLDGGMNDLFKNRKKEGGEKTIIRILVRPSCPKTQASCASAIYQKLFPWENASHLVQGHQHTAFFFFKLKHTVNKGKVLVNQH